MKKIALTLASVMAAAVFAPEASALPAFARQTGMACSACHQTHFPILNGFGRAFKASGYTMMGAQGKIESDHLSLPETMNSAILLKYRAQHATRDTFVVGQGVTSAVGNASDWQHQMGDEFSFFMGGRIADDGNLSIGFLNENNLAARNAMPLVAGLRVPVNYDFGVAKVTVVPFSTDALGAAYGFELSSGGVMRANRWAEHRRETSAIQYSADRGAGGGNAAGMAFVVQNDMGYVNYTKWSSSFFPGAGGGDVPSTNFGQTYLRVAATPTVANWEIVAGFGIESGNSYANLGGGQVEANQTFFDFQAHGEVAGMMTGVYLQNAVAPKCAANIASGNCEHNTGSVDRKATTIGAEFQVVPHALNVGLAYRLAENGSVDANNAAKTDNAITLTALYDLVQNVALVANFSQYSGTAYAGEKGSQQLTTLMLEAAW
ncbi:MAG: hypothetical protein WCI39_04285 [Gallionellaceae bacterium]